MNLSIGLAGTARTRPLVDGRVPIAGIGADVTVMGVQALFNLQLATHRFDVCEFPIVTYLRSLEAHDQPYLAIPVFPSRHFRLSCIFVAEASKIDKPADLAGRRIGLPVFDMAAAVWVRGILHDFHGLDRHAPTYVTAGPEGPRRATSTRSSCRPRSRWSGAATPGWPSCSPPARSMRSTPPGRRRPGRARACADCSRTPGPWSSTTTPPPGSSPPCTCSR